MIHFNQRVKTNAFRPSGGLRPAGYLDNQRNCCPPGLKVDPFFVTIIDLFAHLIFTWQEDRKSYRNMKILEYLDLDTSKVGPQYQKVIEFLEKDDFHSAEVKKLAEHDIYRAKLDDSNRLLFKIVSYEGVRYALILEVVLNHAYGKSKFLGGAPIDESKIPVTEATPTEKEKLSPLVYLNPSRDASTFWIR